MNRERLFRLNVFWIWVVILLPACSAFGPKPDIVSEEKGEGSKYSSAEVRQMTLDNPRMLSADYFWEKTQAKGRQSEKGDASEAEDALAAAATGAGMQPAADLSGADDQFGLKVGLLLDPKNIDGNAVERVRGAAAEAVHDNIILVNDVLMREVLASTDCLETMDLACISRETAVYPGVRMLVLVESLHLPESEGEAVMRFSVVDAGLQHSYPAIEIRRQINDLPVQKAFIVSALAEAYDYAVRKADVMPRHCRIFSVQGDSIFISAGRLAGLNTGDTLSVVEGGEVVRTPTGMPVSWLPESTAGVIQVQKFVGEDAAACVRVSGEAAEIGDYVLFSDKN